MAEQQRIHPVTQDVEAAQTPATPLVPRNMSKSENGDPVEQHYPPMQRMFPVMHSKPPKRRSCCCKCFCWTISLILLLLVITAVAASVLFLVFRPKLPSYSIDRLQITQFNVDNNSSLSATFQVTITASNPNHKIGIYYEGGSHIDAWYTSTKLCEGSFPKFYQGHHNTTVLNVMLSGQIQYGLSLMTALRQQQQQTGVIPLNLRVKQPVRIKLGELKIPKVKFLVRCRLDVDSLSANNEIKIRNNNCKFDLRL